MPTNRERGAPHRPPRPPPPGRRSPGSTWTSCGPTTRRWCVTWTARGAPRDRGRQGERLRARGGAGGAGPGVGRGRHARLRGHRRGGDPARRRRPGAHPRLRRPRRQRSGRRVHPRPDADRLLAVRRPRVGGRGGAAARDGPVPPEDRHRHEPARVPLRQPPLHAAGRPGPVRARDRGGVHALRHRRRACAPPCSTCSGSASTSRCAASPGWASGPGFGTPRTAPPCCATGGPGTTRSGPGSCSTASCPPGSRRRRRWRRR